VGQLGRSDQSDQSDISDRSDSLKPQASSLKPKAVGLALFGPYVIGVELASLLLLAGLVAAFHLGAPDESENGKGGER
jgi:NADH:ubiquinone oxidoreductase subunit 6 (subunit J)